MFDLYFSRAGLSQYFLNLVLIIDIQVFLSNDSLLFRIEATEHPVSRISWLAFLGMERPLCSKGVIQGQAFGDGGQS